MKRLPILALSALAAGLGAQQGGPALAAVGKTVSYKFQKSIANSRGVGSLADLRGTPVMIEFWGVN